MKGSISTDQKCPICGGKYAHDDRRDGLFCLKHPEQQATKFRVRFGKTQKRFQDYHQARQFLNGLRYKTIEGSYDARDYQKDNPLGFESLALKWLDKKKREVKPRSHQPLVNFMSKAIKAWRGKNIKAIGYAEIEDLLFEQNISDKTRYNMRSCLHDFWVWLRKRRVLTLAQMPEFPEISFELGWRKIVDKETQETIIDEVCRISYDINPKIWLGIKWLSTYISMRPVEMLDLTESNVDTKLGCLIIPHPKEKEPKLIYLLDEDIELIEEMPRGLPALPFFRHVKGLSGVKAGEKFGPRYLFKWWKKACANLGVEGVDLYGGTRHSTTTALSEVLTPEEIKKGTLHTTNKAFERYMQSKAVDARKVYQKATQLTRKKKAEVVKFSR